MGSMDLEYADKLSDKEDRLNKDSKAHENWLAESEERKKSENELRAMQKRSASEVEDSGKGDNYKVLYSVKKAKTVTLELPKNPWNSPEVTSMLDRTKLTSRQAVGVFSALVKSGTSAGGEEVT